ncbi:uncharacterized protein LOC129742067 [Uranotaenia lowii]|uniref:uncharacterized protein LOC129742067 n=1 Tax=Uranotaenia lowii TaxID=190385 RepID=UPI00247A3C92|nr:uncharacterized protein LOC129742067 [Uranotaenia lowii]
MPQLFPLAACKTQSQETLLAGSTNRSSCVVSEDGFLIISTEEGVKIYEFDDQLKLRFLALDGRYHSTYGWTQRDQILQLGFFYHDAAKIGIFGRDSSGNITFEAVIKNEARLGSQQPIWRMTTDPGIDSSWTKNGSDIYLANVDNTKQQAFVVRDQNGLGIYKFNEKHIIRKLLFTEAIAFSGAENDRVWFGRLSARSSGLLDLIHINSTGLFGYKYNEARQDYVPEIYIPQFAFRLGWGSRYMDSVLLHDFNKDGKDELMYSDPSGLSVLKISLDNGSVEKVLLDRDLPVFDRHAKSVTIAKFLTSDKIVLVSARNATTYDLQRTTYPTPPSTIDVKDALEIVHPIPLVPSIDSFLSVKYIHDQLILSEILHPRNPLLGVLDFSVPVVNVPNAFGIPITHSIRYKEYGAVDIFGSGWSINVDCIYVDYAQSIFPIDHEYYLVKDGVQSHLRPKSKHNGSETIFFTLEGSPDVEVQYLKSQKLWEVRTKKELLSFGSLNNFDCIQYETNSYDEIKPVVWLLSEKRDNHHNFLNYIYDQQYGKLQNNRTYVKDLNLLRITSNNGDSVSFNYTSQNNTRLVTSIKILTSDFEQNLTFEYDSTKAATFLTGIYQMGIPVLQFKYEGAKSEMTEIKYPNGLISKFSYNFLSFPQALKPYKYKFASDAQVVYGFSYMIIGGKTEANQVQIIALDVVGSKTNQISSLYFPLLGKEPVESFQILTTRYFFVVILSHKSHKELCLFRQKTEGWSSEASYMKMPKESILMTGKSFVLIKQSNKLAVLNLISDKWDIKPVFNNLSAAAIVKTFSYAYLVFNDRRLFIGFQDFNNDWITRQISIEPNLFDNSLDVLHKFVSESDTLKNLKQILERDFIHTHHNAVVIRAFELNDQNIISVLYFYHYDNEFNLIHQGKESVIIENLETYVLDLPPVDSNIFKIGYTRHEDKFKVTVFGVTGPIMSEVERLKQKVEEEIQKHPNAPKKEKDRYRTEAHDKLNDELQQIYKNVTASIPLAIDPAKFALFVNEDHVIAASRKLYFNGKQWQQEKIPDENIKVSNIKLKLGDSLILTKLNRNDTFKLRHSSQENEFLWDSGTMSGSDLLLNYPTFIGVQRPDSVGQIYLFGNNKLNSLGNDEYLSRLSNHLAVITESKDRKTVSVRSLKSLLEYRQNVITSEELVYSENNVKLTRFEYDSSKVRPYSEGIAFIKSKILPGGNPTRFGWLEETFNLTDRTRSVKTVHNSKGVVVKNIIPDAPNEDQAFDKDKFLMDLQDRLVIADFRPYRISQEVVSYYGFEPYEANRVGTGKSWMFERALIIQEESNHFIRLVKNTSVNGSFKPKLKGLPYVFSCWIRTPDNTLIERSVALNISNSGRLLKNIIGKVQANVGDWKYVEATFEGIQSEQDIQLDVIIKNFSNQHIDVDHVRVSPLNFDFNANIYDKRSGKIKAIMKSTGLLQQILHDQFGNVKARISQGGLLEVFTMKTQASGAPRKNFIISRVEMKPAFGEIIKHDSQSSNGKSIRQKLKYSSQVISIRCLYKFSGEGNQLLGFQNIIAKLNKSGTQTLFRIGNNKPVPIPAEGELALLYTKSRIAVWVQGHLIAEMRWSSDPEVWKHVELKSSGAASITEVLFMYDPVVKVFYLNKLGLAIQELILSDHNSVNIRQIVYDDIDRPVLKTKWTRITPDREYFFKYNSELIANLDNILNNRKATGLVNQLNSDCYGYPYTWISYNDTPLETKLAMGLPGKPYSVDGSFHVKYGNDPSVSLLKNLFPQNQGFQHNFELNSGGAMHVQVLDSSSNKVAEFVKVLGHEHRLTTYEYDSLNRLVRVLPPMYHETANTFSQTDSFKVQVANSSNEELRNLWGKQYRYDPKGRLVEKVTPDSGRQQFLYTEEGLLRFIVNSDSTVVYHTYRFDGRIVEKGILNLPYHQLMAILENNSKIPKTSEAILFDYGEHEKLPSIRHQVIKSRKISIDAAVTEVLLFNDREQLLNQIFVAANSSVSLDYDYNNDRISRINYPILVYGKTLKVTYDYHADGNVKNVYKNNDVLVSIKYTPSNSIAELEFEPKGHFSYKRSFSYNEPGYLSKITDNFLSEDVQYITGSYGGVSFGDGTVSATTFNATWHERSNIDFVRLKTEHFRSNRSIPAHDTDCFEPLKKLGYLDEFDRPLNLFYPLLELQMPLGCNTGSRANQIASILTSKGFPIVYGHRYDYENHKQLIKAKYFQNSLESSLEPLHDKIFSNKIRGISVSESKTIWNTLNAAGFIITDCSNRKYCQAHQGKSLFHPTVSSHINAASLEILFSNGIRARKDIPEKIFLIVCKVWHQSGLINHNEICRSMWKDLISHNFVGPQSNRSLNTLDPILKQSLKSHSRHLTDIVTLLLEHFAKALGHSEGDIQSYGIDSNGNHIKFYTGFRRYRLEYVANSNRISKIYLTDLKTEDLKEMEYTMEHDQAGSVTKATHKGILKIEYDRLINRAKLIHMVDGTKVTLRYNVRGERIFKQVRNSGGLVSLEKYYVRDYKGRCLMDYEITFLDKEKSYVRETAYIFAGNTMLGFIRNDQFYSVFTDHEGSVRLVIKNGEVVAAYDYLPYGQMLRKFNSDPEADVSYRYTGQEWDEETGLYNFNARLYDPDIGRFYQVDPKEQYPSPYVYAGNSPISLIDPDGQFAFLIVVAFAVGGAYLGSSAANNSFNPFKWKLKPTLIGGFMGGLLGGLAPAGIGASFAFLTGTVGLTSVAAGGVMIGTSLGFAYLSGASANQNWNPLDWNWSSPGTWNSLFSGSLTGATLFAGVGKVHQKFIAISGLENVVFVGVVAGSVGGIALFTGSMENDWNLSFWEWDWSKPQTVWKVTMGASFGLAVSADLHKIHSQVVNKVKDFKGLIKTLKAGEIENFWIEANIYFKDSKDLIIEIKDTLRRLSTAAVKSPSGIAHVIVSRPKAFGKDTAVGTVQNVLFELAKFGPLENAIGELKEQLEDIDKLNRREGFRKKRDVNCCELQLYKPKFNEVENDLKNSASSLKFSLFQDLFEYLKFFDDVQSKNRRKAQNSYPGFPKSFNKKRKPYKINNCIRFDNSDTNPYVRCFGIDYHSYIFSHIEETVLLTEDHYSYCTPLEFQGQPSVVCHGKSSSFLASPYAVANVLDHVNGAMMLAMVVPQTMRNIADGVRSVFNFFSQNSNTKLITNADDLINLDEKLETLQQNFELLKSNCPCNMRWIENIIEDLHEDVELFRSGCRLNSFHELIDRLEVIDQEIRDIVLEENFQCSSFNPTSIPHLSNLQQFSRNMLNINGISVKSSNELLLARN